MRAAIFTRNDAPENPAKLRFQMNEPTENYAQMIARLSAESLAESQRRRLFLENSAPDVVVIAEFGPGFSSDLSNWILTLSSSGVLEQHIEIKNFDEHSQDGPRRDVATVGSEFVASILARADELDFWNLNAVNPNESVTDSPFLKLSIRHGERERTYRPESVGYHAYRGHEGAKHFMELWNSIHQHAPFPPKD